MNLLHGLPGLRQIPPRSILSIGNYDGVHRGHQALLSLARRLREQSPLARLAVATFEPHPLTVLRPDKAPPRLASLESKRKLLAEQGVDDLIELPPEPAVLDLTAEQFFLMLRDHVRVAHLVEGSLFNFGKGRGGNIARLREWAAGTSVSLHVVGELETPLLDLRLTPISSTVIRWLIAYGRVREAAICLGRPYALAGNVVKGFARGRTLGYPTANLHCENQLIPPDAVYAGRCTVDGHSYPAAISIGTLPTFGAHQRQVEAYLIGFTGDLYDRPLEFELLDWLREQRKYASVDALKAQIEVDAIQTMERAAQDMTAAVGARVAAAPSVESTGASVRTGP